MNDDWESKTVIGYKKRVAKVAKNDSELNGTSSSLSLYTAGTDPIVSRKYSHATPSFTSLTCTQARRIGGVVATEKKISPGNKANQGMSNLPRVITPNLSHLLLGTDHQRIAKLDRENEVAPLPKIEPSTGAVGRAFLDYTCLLHYCRLYEMFVTHSDYLRRNSLRKLTRSFL